MKRVIIYFLIIFTCVSCATITPKDVSETGQKISDTFFLSSFFNPFAAAIGLAGNVLHLSGEAAGYIVDQHKGDNEEEKKDAVDDTIIVY